MLGIEFKAHKGTPMTRSNNENAQARSRAAAKVVGPWLLTSSSRRARPGRADQPARKLSAQPHGAIFGAGGRAAITEPRPLNREALPCRNSMLRVRVA
jgi:hypothetical protein